MDLPIYLPTWLFYETSSFFQVDNIKNAALLRDFLVLWSWPHQTESNSARPPPFLSWPHQKRNNPARLPSFLNLTTSKTKQCCETSSFFTLDNIKNKAILRHFLQKWKVECSADSLVPVRFAIFPLHLSKVLRLPRKSEARSYEVLHLSRKIILANLQVWCSKMQPLSGNQRPDLLTSLMNMSFVLRLPQKMHLCRSSSNVPRLPSFLEMQQNPHVLLMFEKVHSLAPATRNEIWMSKSGPYVVCFVHFDFEMCFAPQRRPLFQHLNFQKWSENGVLCTFWLQNAFRATTACTFSTSQLQKVVRTWCVLFILTWKRASRHNGVHFFDIATSKSGPNVRCF